jgi:hypothetical protein
MANWPQLRELLNIPNYIRFISHNPDQNETKHNETNNIYEQQKSSNQSFIGRPATRNRETESTNPCTLSTTHTHTHTHTQTNTNTNTDTNGLLMGIRIVDGGQRGYHFITFSNCQKASTRSVHPSIYPSNHQSINQSTGTVIPCHQFVPAWYSSRSMVFWTSRQRSVDWSRDHSRSVVNIVPFDEEMAKDHWEVRSDDELRVFHPLTVREIDEHASFICKPTVRSVRIPAPVKSLHE